MSSGSPAMTLPLQGQEVENLMNCNRKLHELGIDATIRLPQIVVVGDQSTGKSIGKSSLIEALSLVKVPRAPGRCTQCPLAINLTTGEHPDSEWQCGVFIEERFRYELSSPEAYSTSPLGPWKSCPLTVYPFKTTKDKNEVCHLIKAASQAILNPIKSRMQYPPEISESLTNEVLFSPNVVRLDISQPGLPSLSFIDLPGVIASPDRSGDAYLVSLVDNLVKLYAQDASAMVLLTLPMTNDIVNSKGRQLILEIEAQSRTLAVLTKPDRVQEDALNQYMNKLLLKDDPVFAHGYRLVMMDPDVDLNHTDARLKESKFFASEPWCSLGEHKERLGVESLRLFLQKILFAKIGDALPDNLIHIETRLGHIEAQLSRFPPAPDLAELPLIFERTITRLDSNLRTTFEEVVEADHQSFRQQWNTLTARFRTSIASSYPRVILRSAAEERRSTMAASKQAKVASTNSKVLTKSSQTIEISSDEDSPSLGLDSKPHLPEVKAKISKAGVQATDDGKIYYRFRLEEIRQINQKHSLAGMPRQSCPVALKEMMSISINWYRPFQQFMNAVARTIVSHVLRLIETIFGRFRQFTFFNAVEERVKTYLDSAIGEEWSRAEATLELEKGTPYTLNNDEYEAKYEQNLTEKITKRNATRLRILQAEYEASSSNPKKQLTLDALGPDDFKIEIEMAAHVRAYYDIAMARFVDVICQGMKARLFTTCSEKLVADLKEYIGVDQPDQQATLQEWFSERPDIERQRRTLLHERARLIEGKEYIMNALGTSANPTEKAAPEITPSSTRVASKARTPASTPTKRGLPEEFDMRPASTGKKLSGVSNLSIRSPAPESVSSSRTKFGSTSDEDTSVFL